MRSVAFATQDPPESPKTYPVGGEPLIWIVYFLFNGVDAENPTEGPEPRYAKMTPYAAAAQEYLKVHYEVHTETIAIQKYYCLVTEKALTLAQVEPGHQTVLSAPLVGKWMGGQIRKEALKKCYAQTTLRIVRCHKFVLPLISTKLYFSEGMGDPKGRSRGRSRGRS